MVENAGNQGGDNQAGSATWRNSVEEGIRAEKSLDVFKGNTWDEVGPQIAKSYVASEKMIGGSIRVPKEDAKPEEWDGVWNKLGRPESPDKYQINLPYTEYINWSQDRIKELATAAHRAGFTGKQIQAVIDVYGKQQADDYQAQKKSFEDAVTNLRSEWGGSFDKNIALIRRARDLYGGDGAKEYFKDDPRGNDVVLLRMIARMAADLEEGDFLGGPGEAGGLNAEEAKAKIAEIMKDPNDLYHAKFAMKPGHEERVREVQALYDIGYRAI
jgi:hypothetical protein